MIDARGTVGGLRVRPLVDARALMRARGRTRYRRIARVRSGWCTGKVGGMCARCVRPLVDARALVMRAVAPGIVGLPACALVGARVKSAVCV